MSIWPGLARLWLRGSLRGLCLACVFGVVLNLALITTFVWPQLLSRQLPSWGTPVAAWILVLWFWIVGRRGDRPLLAGKPPRGDLPTEEQNNQLRQAQTEYLKGHWVEAESLLGNLLRDRPDDWEAGLLLGTIFRRTKRIAEARRAIGLLAEHERGLVWRTELSRELASLDNLERELKEASEAAEPPALRRAA